MYNATNQMTQNGATALTYDLNGNLTSDGANTYAWDAANRLRTVGTTQYLYDGDGNRISQTVGALVTTYLLDTQPGLAVVIGETSGVTTTRYLHSPRGIHSSYVGSTRTDYLTDGLGSVRTTLDSAGTVLSSVNYSPYGVPDTSITGFAFTGEQRDSDGLQYHRARYYNPGLGIWASLDPLETQNRYGYVNGNPVSFVDASGLSSCSCERYINMGVNFDFNQYVRCVLENRTHSASGIALASAAIIYTFFDGLPNLNGTSCEMGFAPASMSMGTITVNGIYTHDHYSRFTNFNPISSVATTEFSKSNIESQTAIRGYGCVEFRGQKGTKAVAGETLTFVDAPDGIVIIAGDFTSIGCPAKVALQSPVLGERVSYVVAKTNLVIGRQPFFFNFKTKVDISDS